MMETTFDNNNNSNSNSSVSSPSTNNLINPANAALTPGFVDRSRKSIGPTIFSSIHLQRGKGDNYNNNSNTILVILELNCLNNKQIINSQLHHVHHVHH